MARCDEDPILDSTCTPLELDDSEQELFDDIAAEQVNIAGTPFQYYHLNISGSTRDPLWDEPIERNYQGPYTLKGFFEYPETTTSAEERGFHTSWTGSIWVARLTVEQAGAPTPIEGGIVIIWDTDFFKLYAVDEESVPGARHAYDITDVDTDGHMFDTATFVGFKLTLSRRTEFAPERKLG